MQFHWFISQTLSFLIGYCDSSGHDRGQTTEKITIILTRSDGQEDANCTISAKWQAIYRLGT